VPNAEFKRARSVACIRHSAFRTWHYTRRAWDGRVGGATFPISGNPPFRKRSVPPDRPVAGALSRISNRCTCASCGGTAAPAHALLNDSRLRRVVAASAPLSAMKTHLLASLLLTGAPLLACDQCEPADKAKPSAPVATAAPAAATTTPSKTSSTSSVSTAPTDAAPNVKLTPSASAPPTRPAPASGGADSQPLRPARPAYLFM
jgi:hypothetical protein